MKRGMSLAVIAVFLFCLCPSAPAWDIDTGVMEEWETTPLRPHAPRVRGRHCGGLLPLQAKGPARQAFLRTPGPTQESGVG